MNASILKKDPFRLFFPLGGILAFAGVVPWVYQLFTHASYPRDIHRVLMVNGFLLSFVTGFLMTAIPRFTGGKFATKNEIFSVLGLLILSGIGALTSFQAINYIFSALALMALALFAGKRFLNKTSNPPYTFVFIGIGLFLWLLSNLGMTAVSIGILGHDPISVAITTDLFSNGAIMSLILGVGGRLIPGILGWQEIVTRQRVQYEAPTPFIKLVPKSIWIASLIFVTSFALRPTIPFQFCLFMRFAVTLYFAIWYWKIYRLPVNKTFLTWSIWFCCWCLVLGYLLPILWTDAYVHAIHLLFISGFSLLTLLISIRVSFAHSAVGTEAEKPTPTIFVFVGLILTATLIRVLAILWPEHYLSHLGYAALLWIFALGVWGVILFSRAKIIAKGE